MGNTGPSGILSLPNKFSTANAINAGTAILLSTQYVAIERDFLLKKLRARYGAHQLDPNDGLVIGFCRGDMTVGEIKAVIEKALLDPDDFQEWDEFAMMNGIFWETLEYVSDQQDAVNEAYSVGGGKGLPLQAGKGIGMFAYNPDGGNTATIEISGVNSLVGVFMEGSD